MNGTPRWQLAAGKWPAACAAGLAGTILTLATLSWVPSRLSLEQLGVRIHLGAHELILLSLAMAPLALLLPAIQTCLACFARSYKEAQSYAVVLIIPVVAAGIAIVLVGVVARMLATERIVFGR